jgi:hypothetical protein
MHKKIKEKERDDRYESMNPKRRRKRYRGISANLTLPAETIK